MSIPVALDLGQQLTNLSLGRTSSTSARYARSILAGNSETPAGLSTGDLDSTFYNLGVAIKETLAGSSARLGVAYDAQQQSFARAVAFVRGVGSWELGTHFDRQELNQAQAWFALAPSVFRFQAEAFTAASADTDAGNNGAFFGSWTSVNPDVDVQQQVDGTINVGWTNLGEWLEWNRPLLMTNGSYSVSLRLARAPGNVCAGDVNGVSYSVPSTTDWTAFEDRLNVCTVLVSGATTALRYTFTTEFNLDWMELTRI